MAFAVEGYLDNEIKDDPRYVKWIARIFGATKDQGTYEKIKEVHKCTEEDYSKFSPIEKKSQSYV